MKKKDEEIVNYIVFLMEIIEEHEKILANIEKGLVKYFKLCETRKEAEQLFELLENQT